MGYEVHIERRNESNTQVAIPVEEWLRAVEQTDGVRPLNGPVETTAPRTGEAIRFAAREGDAEVYFPEDASWEAVLMYTARGAITVAASQRFLQSDDPVRQAVVSLAKTLGAVVVGDSGEMYE